MNWLFNTNTKTKPFQTKSKRKKQKKKKDSFNAFFRFPGLIFGLYCNTELFFLSFVFFVSQISQLVEKCANKNTLKHGKSEV